MKMRIGFFVKTTGEGNDMGRDQNFAVILPFSHRSVLKEFDELRKIFINFHIFCVKCLISVCWREGFQIFAKIYQNFKSLECDYVKYLNSDNYLLNKCIDFKIILLISLSWINSILICISFNLTRLIMCTNEISNFRAYTIVIIY